MFCPERLKPKPTDDQGVFSTQNPNGVMEGEYGAEDHQDTDCSAVVKITNSALDREEAEGLTIARVGVGVGVGVRVRVEG